MYCLESSYGMRHVQYSGPAPPAFEAGQHGSSAPLSMVPPAFEATMVICPVFKKPGYLCISSLRMATGSYRWVANSLGKSKHTIR